MTMVASEVVQTVLGHNGTYVFNPYGNHGSIRSPNSDWTSSQIYLSSHCCICPFSMGCFFYIDANLNNFY